MRAVIAMSKPHSVLIVDDEPNILLSLQFLMNKSGYEVRTAKDGEEALAEISRAAPDLVLLDVMMPKIDGFSMCERIRANPEWRDMRIIMLTARGRDVERDKGLALGADDYITKPFSTQGRHRARRGRARAPAQGRRAVRRLSGTRCKRKAAGASCLTALFLLGVLLLTPPLLIVFNQATRSSACRRSTSTCSSSGPCSSRSSRSRSSGGMRPTGSTRPKPRRPAGTHHRSPGQRPMLSGPVIITVAFLYLCLLFAIAYYGDKRADQGRSLIANPSIYALSIAVYCTSWTFYGSVGRAASSGVDFLPIYLGPTLTFIVGWFVIRKIIRISKVNRTTSIADFVASRYGKSFQLGGLVTVIAVVGILPYISLQLKAISTSFSLLLHYPEIVLPTQLGERVLPAGHGLLRRTVHGRVRDPVRNPPYRRERAARRHGGGDRVRVGRQARSHSSPSACS